MKDYDNNEKNIDIGNESHTNVTPSKNEHLATPKGDNTVSDELLDAVCDIANMCKEQYKSASKKDKATILAIILPLAVLFIIGAVGVFLANFGQAFVLRELEVAGFVLMGIGIGGFFLYIIGILIWNKFRK